MAEFRLPANSRINKDGKVHISNSPPDKPDEQPVKMIPKQYTPPPVVRDEPTLAPEGAAATPPAAIPPEDGGDDAADALRYLVATKSRAITVRKLRGL